MVQVCSVLISKGKIMNVTPVSFAGMQGVANVKECCEPKKASELKLMDQPQQDTVSFSGRSDEMSDLDKKELILKARTSAAGWSVFFSGFSTLYYAMRSDNTVAKKYDLDPIEDKKLIKQIKKEQVIHTIPGLLELGLVGYIYNKCFANAEDIDL